VRQKFTGYQKDTETGLDFAEARMYNNAHGRFTAVDPLMASGRSANPQTFNRYTYVLNHPLIAVDYDGKKPVYIVKEFKTYTDWEFLDNKSPEYKNLIRDGYKEYTGKLGVVIENRNNGKYYQLTKNGFKAAVPIRAGEKEFDPSNNPVVGFNVAGAFVSSVTAGFVEFGDQNSREYQNSKTAADVIQYASAIKSLAKIGVVGTAALVGIIKATVNSSDDIAKLAYTVTKGAKIGQCIPTANALEDIYKAKGVAGEVIQLRTESGAAIEIVSDVIGGNTPISTNGIHQAVRVGDVVFDNIHKNGIKYAEWIKDFNSRDNLVVDVLRTF
jgi:RHS repeat-associated protein